MSEQLLTILKYFLIVLIWLFFLRVTRSAWAEVRRPRAMTASKVALPIAVERPIEDGHGKRHSALPWLLSVVEPPEMQGTTFEIQGDMSIGRAEGCAICLATDNYASHLHARIFMRNGAPFLEDLGSTNGTWVNSAQIESATELYVRDRVQIGLTVFEVSR